jgi:Na+-driven multidrug efflux pump
MALGLVLLRPLYIPIFTIDPEVRALVSSLAIVVAATQPIGAVLYVLDGVLIGAGDGRYLAWAMLVAVAVFLPLAGLVLVTGAGIVALWWALRAGSWRGRSRSACAIGPTPGSGPARRRDLARRPLRRRFDVGR